MVEQTLEDLIQLYMKRYDLTREEAVSEIIHDLNVIK